MSNLKNKVEQYSDKALIIGGDLNTYLDATLDEKKVEQQKNSSLIVKI